jgi:putative lipase involved disintegration of autophagic bodies
MKRRKIGLIFILTFIVLVIFAFYSGNLISTIKKSDSLNNYDEQKLSSIFHVNIDDNIQITSLCYMTYLKRKYFVLEIQNSDIDYFKQMNPHILTYDKLKMNNILLPSKRYKPRRESFNVYYKNNTVFISVNSNELKITDPDGYDYLSGLIFTYSL